MKLSRAKRNVSNIGIDRLQTQFKIITCRNKHIKYNKSTIIIITENMAQSILIFYRTHAETLDRNFRKAHFQNHELCRKTGHNEMSLDCPVLKMKREGFSRRL